jgi:hypothetical protein
MVSAYVNKCMTTPCAPHYLAAWIQDENKKYVRSVFKQMGDYLFALVNYVGLGNDCQFPQETIDDVDAIGMATYFAHEQHRLLWDGLLGSGHKAAPAGSYHLMIEVAIDDERRIVSDTQFMFGDPTPVTTMLQAGPADTGVALTYTPNP